MKVRTALMAGATMLLGALAPGAAQAATLFSTIDQPYDVVGANSEFAAGAGRIAQPFTVTTTGVARSVSFFAQRTTGDGSGPVTMSIHASSGPTPGALLASGSTTADEITGSSPSCVQLGAQPTLIAGQTYWAVFGSDVKGASWLFHREAPRVVLLSSNAGISWGPATVQKTVSLRVVDVTACTPDINPNPTPGTLVADMITRSGQSTWATIFIGNNGTTDLRLTSGGFSGPNAGAFRLLRGEPNGPDNAQYTFPQTIGASAQGGSILYVVCDGAGLDGVRTATFTLNSNDPDESSISWPVSCLIDSTPPTVAFSQTPNGTNGWFKTSPAALTVSGVDPESGNRVKAISCTDTNGPTLSFNAGSVATFSLAANGIHTLACRATDVANNVTPPPGVATIVKIDSIPPTATKGAGPDGPTTSTSASFAFTAGDTVSGLVATECSLDGGGFVVCTSPHARSGLADGAHTLLMRAVDAAANTTTVSWTWRVDTTPPNSTVLGGPSTLTNTQNATFAPAATDPGGNPGVTLQCALDGAAFATCVAPASYAALSEGQHVFATRGVDAVGNVDATPATYTWTIDLTAPTARVVSGPPARASSTSATFTFAADTPGPAPHDRYECRLDGAPYVVCPSPITFTGLGFEQEHALDVRSIDTIGNAQSPATRYTWRTTNAPFAADDTASTTAGLPVEVNVLANDVEPLGGSLTITLFSASSALGATITQTAGGLTYTPLPGVTGTDTFAYRITGSTGLQSEAATVTVEVGPAPPVVVLPIDPPPVTTPIVPAGTPVVPEATVDRVAPRITGVGVVGRQLSFKLSEAARVTIKVERLVNRKWKVVARAGSTRNVKVGTTRVTLPKGMIVGRYRVTVGAVDPAGNKARNVLAGFRVKAPKKPTPKP